MIPHILKLWPRTLANSPIVPGENFVRPVADAIPPQTLITSRIALVTSRRTAPRGVGDVSAIRVKDHNGDNGDDPNPHLGVPLVPAGNALHDLVIPELKRLSLLLRRGCVIQDGRYLVG